MNETKGKLKEYQVQLVGTPDMPAQIKTIVAHMWSVDPKGNLGFAVNLDPDNTAIVEMRTVFRVCATRWVWVGDKPTTQ